MRIHSTETLQEHILNLSPQDLYHLVEKTSSRDDLRMIVHTRFRAQARMLNEDNTEPFIYWGAMNKELEKWVPLLLGKVTQIELKTKGKRPDVIIAAPNSATPYLEEIRQHKIFPHINYPLVIRKSDISKLELEGEPHEIISVRSYVHDRHLVTGPRTSPDVAVFTPELMFGADVLMLDDVIAESVTVDDFARSLKAMGAKHVYAAAVMTKEIQGGLAKLKSNSAVDFATALIKVTQTNGSQGEIKFQ